MSSFEGAFYYTYSDIGGDGNTYFTFFIKFANIKEY